MFYKVGNSQCIAGYWHSIRYYNGTVPRWGTKNKIAPGPFEEWGAVFTSLSICQDGITSFSPYNFKDGTAEA